MKERSISATILVTILVTSILIGYKAFGIVMLIFACLGSRELIGIKYGEKSKNIEIVKLIGYISLFLIVLNDTYLHIDNKFLMIL